MCLTRIDARYEVGSKEYSRVRKAWKILRTKPFEHRYVDENETPSNGLYFLYPGTHNQDQSIPRGTWSKAVEREVYTSGDGDSKGVSNYGSYTSGFHVFRTRKDAITYTGKADWQQQGRGDVLEKIIPVKVRGVRVKGEEAGFGMRASWVQGVMVADEMYVPKEKK